MTPATPGSNMAAEIAEAAGVFKTTASADWSARLAPLGLTNLRALYTIARGSSDAAATVLAYEFMRHLRVPVTSLPPSIFSLGAGVDLTGTATLLISQSGGSDDLVMSARGAARRGAKVLAITNTPGSPVEAEAHVTLPIGAGEEKAVPATKTVIGSVAAGMALLSVLVPSYDPAAAVAAFPDAPDPVTSDAVRAFLLRARHLFVIGRDTGYGAAQEIALKVKETCAIHAEAYSASEVLHGPLQLATKRLSVLILDTGTEATQASLDAAQARFSDIGCDSLRLAPDAAHQTPASAAALLLLRCYPAILDAGLALGLNPDAPSTLRKVTQTT